MVELTFKLQRHDNYIELICLSGTHNQTILSINSIQELILYKVYHEPMIPKLIEVSDPNVKITSRGTTIREAIE